MKTIIRVILASLFIMATWQESSNGAQPVAESSGEQSVQASVGPSTIVGEYDVCWVGNSFPGGGGQNGFGYWVQNAADEIEVAPNGLVVAGCGWDEAGRCAGLYKDGKVNRVLLKQEGGPDTAWGWNTGNHAIAIDGTNIYVANEGKRLLRFVGEPDDLDSWSVRDEIGLPEEPVGASANYRFIVIAYKDSIELREAMELRGEKRWKAPEGEEVRDVLIRKPDPQDPSWGETEIWAIVGKTLRRFSFMLHEEESGAFEGLINPTAIAYDDSSTAKTPTLIVCDAGLEQQVKFYDVSDPTNPKLVRTVGEKGGIFSKTTVDGKPLAKGEDAPLRFYGLRGAGTDRVGNLYVSLGLNDSPCGGLTLRAFDAKGTLRWELANHAFVDTFGFDPDSDGARIYTRTAIIDVDPDSPNPDLGWKKVATTIDETRYTKKEDERPTRGMTATVRRLQGKTLLCTIGQYGGGYNFFTFDEEHDGKIARPVGRLHPDGETWAHCIDVNGDVWHGDYWQTKSILRYRFKGWEKVDNTPAEQEPVVAVKADEDEKDENAENEKPRYADGGIVPDAPAGETIYRPVYDLEAPDVWPVPEDFDHLRRLVYVPETDTLYVSGYLKGEEVDSWGVCGKTVRRYDDWTKPTRRVVWTVKTPVNPEGENGKPLTPQGLAVAGDYLFFGMVKADDDGQRTYAMDAKTGKIVGYFVPGGVAENNAGWQDMPYSVAAIERKDGSYLVMVEEDWRGKNVVYRWRPDAK